MSTLRRPTKRLGRPRIGAEPLNTRLTILVAPSTLRDLERRAGAGQVASFVRATIAAALRRDSLAARTGNGRPGRPRIRRYGQGRE